MVKKVIISGAILLLLGINIMNIVRRGPNIMSIAAIIVCCICLVLMLVDRMRKD